MEHINVNDNRQHHRYLQAHFLAGIGREDETDWCEEGEKENWHEKGDRVEAIVTSAVDCHLQRFELVLGNQVRDAALFV